jgi:hypothetical protein
MIEAKQKQTSNLETIPIGSAFLKEAELWMDAQADFLTSLETMMTDWVKRQREAFDASSRSIRRMYDSFNVIDLVQLQHEWVSDCLHWTASEIRAVGNDTATVTRKAAARLGEAARERSNELRKQTDVVVRTEARQPLERAAAE